MTKNITCLLNKHAKNLKIYQTMICISEHSNSSVKSFWAPDLYINVLNKPGCISYDNKFAIVLCDWVWEISSLQWFCDPGFINEYRSRCILIFLNTPLELLMMQKSLQSFLVVCWYFFYHLLNTWWRLCHARILLYPLDLENNLSFDFEGNPIRLTNILSVLSNDCCLDI